MTLREKTIVAALWHVATGIGGRGVGVIATLVITWFLTPEEVGQVAAAVILVTSSRMFTSLGVGQYVVANPRADSSAVFHATVLNLAVTLLAAALVLSVGPLLGPLFGAPRTAALLPALTAAMVMTGIAEIPERLLGRAMRFRTLGLSTASGEAAYAAVSIALAVAGWGGEALVYGNLARSALRLAVAWAAVDRASWLSPSSLRTRTMRDILSFGVPLQIGSLAARGASRWDNLIVSRLFGPGAMGVYGLAYNLADMPSELLGETVADVLLPSFARLPPEQRKAALVRAAAMLSLVVSPLAFGLGTIADTLVATLFDEKWHEVAPLLTLLAAMSVVHPLTNLVQVYLKAAGRTKTVMGLQVAHVVLMLSAVYVLGQFGLQWVAVAGGLAGALYALAGLLAISRAEGVPAWRVIGETVRPFPACAVMVLGLLAIRAGASAVGLAPGVARLAVEVLAGALLYIGAAFLFAPASCRALLAVVRESLRRRRLGAPLATHAKNVAG